MGDKTVLMMANHGVATVGKTVSEAYDRLYYVERVAQVQLYAMWTGQQLKHLPPDGGRAHDRRIQAEYVSVRWQTEHANGTSMH